MTFRALLRHGLSRYVRRQAHGSLAGLLCMCKQATRGGEDEITHQKGRRNVSYENACALPRGAPGCVSDAFGQWGEGKRKHSTLNAGFASIDHFDGLQSVKPVRRWSSALDGSQQQERRAESWLGGLDPVLSSTGAGGASSPWQR